MANVVTVTNQPVVAVQTSAIQSAPLEEFGRRYANTYKTLGKGQIFIGALSIGATVIVLALTGQVGYSVAGGASYTASGIWSGVIFIVAGALGIASARSPIPSKINATMALSIIAAIFAFIMVCIEGSAATASQINRSQTFYYSYLSSSSRRNNVDYESLATAIYAFHVILALLAAVEFIVAIVHSSYCCAATCCGNRRDQMCKRDSRSQRSRPLIAYQPSTVVTTTTTTAPMIVQQPHVAVQQGYPPQNQVFAPGTKAYVAQPPAAGPVQPVFAPQPAYAPQPVAYAPQPGYAPQPVPEIQPGLAPNSGFVPPMEQPPAYSPPGETTPMYPAKS